MADKSVIVRPVVATLAILLIPLLGNLFVEGWNWPWTAFAFFGAVIFGAGLAYELAGQFTKKSVLIGFFFGEVVAIGIIATLRYLNPTEDVAGVVIITFLFSGIFFAFIGYLIQNFLNKN